MRVGTGKGYLLVTTFVSPRDPCACIAKRIEDQVGSQKFSMWFTATRLNIVDDRRLRVEVPSKFVADWIHRHFSQEIYSAAADELGEQAEIELSICPEAISGIAASDLPTSGDVTVGEILESDAGSKPAAKPARPAPPPRRPSGSAFGHEHALPLRYRLDEFVVGVSNQLAHSAACRASEPGHLAGEPLFIHGLCGVGKTHLLQGICARLLERKPDSRVLYTTGEQFTNDYIQAIRNQKLDAFRKRVRRLELLAIDDVHFLAGREKTLQEFLHSFDALELAGSRLVLASDHHPRLVKALGEALISRCLRGLVIEVKPPDRDTRERILMKLAERKNIEFRDGVAEILVSRYQGSVREMEGALTKLEALAMVRHGWSPERSGRSERKVIGRVLVEQLLESVGRGASSRPVRPDEVIRCVGELLGVGREQMLGKGRQAQLVLARSLAMYLMRKLTHLSLPEIARVMKKPGHSGVLSAINRLEDRLKTRGFEKVMLVSPLEPASLLEVVDRLKWQIQRG